MQSPTVQPHSLAHPGDPLAARRGRHERGAAAAVVDDHERERVGAPLDPHVRPRTGPACLRTLVSDSWTTR